MTRLSSEDVPLVEFTLYLFACQVKGYCQRFRSLLLYSLYAFQALIDSLCLLLIYNVVVITVVWEENVYLYSSNTRRGIQHIGLGWCSYDVQTSDQVHCPGVCANGLLYPLYQCYGLGWCSYAVWPSHKGQCLGVFVTGPSACWFSLMFICCRGLRPSSKFQCVYMSIHSRFSAYRFRLVFICCMDLKESSEHGMGMFGKGAPKGGWGCLMFFPMSGISGLSFDSPFLSPLLFFCLVLLLFLSCPFFSILLALIFFYLKHF